MLVGGLAGCWAGEVVGLKGGRGIGSSGPMIDRMRSDVPVPR